MPGGHQWRNHGAVEIAPRWFAVQQQHRCAVGRALVKVVHPQRLNAGRGDVEVVRREGISREADESRVRCAENVHASSKQWCAPASWPWQRVDAASYGPGAVRVAAVGAGGGGVGAPPGASALPLSHSFQGMDQSPPCLSDNGGPPV